jgi:hypothetical protein
MERKLYNSLKEKIAAEKSERLMRHNAYADLFKQAQAAGYAAGDHMTPRIMTVTDSSGNVIERVSEGMCGFASVIVRHANKGFGHWLNKQGIARKSYYGGMEIWIHAHNQSYERKVAHANAMVHVLREGGVECHVSSRLY